MMISLLSKAERRSLKRGARFSRNYRRLLCVRISRKLSLAVDLLNDPLVARHLEALDMDELAQKFYANESFRNSFMFSLGGSPDASPARA